MIAHTAGPWSVWTTMDNTLVIHAIEIANARLIAAAPDLFEASENEGAYCER